MKGSTPRPIQTNHHEPPPIRVPRRVLVQPSLALGVRTPEGLRARISGEYAIPLISDMDNGAAFRTTVRKGLAKDWDLETTLVKSRNRSYARFGIVVFR